MSATITIPKAATPALEKTRSQAFKTAQEGMREQASAALKTGQALILGASTFNIATETDEYRAWCQLATRRSWKTCEQYIAVAKAHAGTKKSADQKLVGSFGFEQQQAYVNTPEELRPALLEQLRGEDNPTVERVREVRDALKLEQLTPAERKEKEEQRKTRERETAASKTEAAVEGLKVLLKGKRLDQLTPETLILLGVGFHESFGKYAEDGVKQFFQQREQRRQQQAERDAAVAAAAVEAAK